MRRNTFLGMVAAMGAVVTMGIGSMGMVSAGEARDPVGSWRFTITEVSPAGEASDPSLATFFADGSMIVHDLPSRAAPAGSGITAVLSSGAHGLWADSGDGGFDLTFVALATTDAGVYLGTGTVTGRGAVDASGNAISGDYAYSAVGVEGDPLGAGAGTFAAERIELMPMP